MNQHLARGAQRDRIDVVEITGITAVRVNGGPDGCPFRVQFGSKNRGVKVSIVPNYAPNAAENDIVVPIERPNARDRVRWILRTARPEHPSGRIELRETKRVRSTGCLFP